MGRLVLVTRQRPVMVDLDDFSGGLNVRDGISIAANEFRDGTLNATLDEHEAAVTRKGCPAAADFPVLPGNPTQIFYSAALGVMILRVGTALYKCAPGGGAWVGWGPVLSSASATTSFVDFKTVLVWSDNAAGIYTYDGAANTLRTAIGVSTLAVWQNKVWAAAGGSADLYWSNVGTPNTWTTGTDVISLVEKDSKPLTALFGGPTLVAFKETSHYRINDSTTGAYTTVDWNAGATWVRAVIGGVAPQASGLIQEGGIFFWGLDGLYAGDGLRPALLIGDKLRPRFIDYSKINGTTKLQICSGIAAGRIYFGFPRDSTTQPDALLEYHPRDRWLLEHRIGTSKPIGFASYSTATRQVTVMADAAGTKLIELNSSDTRTDYDASAVALTVKTGFIAIDEGRLARMRKTVFTVSATVSAAVTFAASYLDDYLGTELSTGLTFGAKTLPAGTSEARFNGSGRAPAFSFTITASGVAITLRRILATFYRAES